MADHRCIASCTHDLGGETRLYAYEPTPDPLLHQAEALAIKTFGFPVRSPLTPYISVWRSEDSVRMDEATAPKKIILNAIFGTEPWQPPPALVKHAEQRQRRDELMFGASWSVTDGEPVLDRFAVEIRTDGGHTHFRAMHGDANARQLDIAWGGLHLPRHGRDTLAFNARVTVPERYNFGEAVRSRLVEVTLTGTAVPIPEWVNY